MSNLTKKALADALKKKVNEKEISKISVTDLTKECGINRQTFYYHFSDIYDLIKWLYTNELIDEIKIDDTYDTWHECYLYIFDYVKQNKKLVLETYNSIGREYLLNFINRQTDIFIMNVINEKTENEKISIELKIFLSNFYRNALIGIIKDWIEKGMLEESDVIIKKLDCALDGSIDLFMSNLKNKNYTF